MRPDDDGWARAARRLGGPPRSGESARPLVKRSFTLAGHRTSVALEVEFWTALARIAEAGDRTLVSLVAELDAARDPGTPLASALRVHALMNAAAPAASH